MSSEPVFAVRSGPWSPDAIADFLDRSAIPIRLASAGKHFPMVQSLWFLHERGALWCCTQDDSVLAQRLRADRRCGFEVAADAAPYRGVRGTGHATLVPDAAGSVLPRRSSATWDRDRRPWATGCSPASIARSRSGSMASW
jgi:hypothetical protein